MKNLILAIALIGAVFTLAWSSQAKCAYCYPYACFDSSICGSGCFCAKLGGGLSGLCAEVN